MEIFARKEKLKFKLTWDVIKGVEKKYDLMAFFSQIPHGIESYRKKTCHGH